MYSMRPATNHDLDNLVALYTDATAYANTVGHIDWKMPFPPELIDELIAQRELFCIDDDNGKIVASFQLKSVADQQKWLSADAERFVYIGKLATTSSMHGTGFGRRVVFPRIIDYARQKGRLGIRLECLADNSRLKNYYLGSGFADKGDITLSRNGATLALSRFEKLV